MTLRWQRAKKVVLHQLKILILWSEMTTGMFVLIQYKLIDVGLCVLRQHEFSMLRKEMTTKGVVTETVFRVLLGVGDCGVTFALTQRRDLEDACQLTFQDHMFQESGRPLLTDFGVRPICSSTRSPSGSSRAVQRAAALQPFRLSC